MLSTIKPWLKPSIQTPRYIALLVKAIFKPTMVTQEAIKAYWDTWNRVYQPDKRPEVYKP